MSTPARPGQVPGAEFAARAQFGDDIMTPEQLAEARRIRQLEEDRLMASMDPQALLNLNVIQGGRGFVNSLDAAFAPDAVKNDPEMEAAKAYQQAVQQASGDPVGRLKEIATALQQQGRGEAAAKVLEQAGRLEARQTEMDTRKFVAQAKMNEAKVKQVTGYDPEKLLDLYKTGAVSHQAINEVMVPLGFAPLPPLQRVRQETITDPATGRQVLVNVKADGTKTAIGGGGVNVSIGADGKAIDNEFQKFENVAKFQEDTIKQAAPSVEAAKLQEQAQVNYERASNTRLTPSEQSAASKALASQVFKSLRFDSNPTKKQIDELMSIGPAQQRLGNAIIKFLDGKPTQDVLDAFREQIMENTGGYGAPAEAVRRTVVRRARVLASTTSFPDEDIYNVLRDPDIRRHLRPEDVKEIFANRPKPGRAPGPSMIGSSVRAPGPQIITNPDGSVELK